MKLVLLVVQRVVLGIVTLWLVSVVVFAATQALPGDAARAILGSTATPESVEELRRQLGLDQPLLTQYGSWLSDVVRGDMGESLTGTHESVTSVVGWRLRNSAILVACAAALGVPLAMGLGALSARWRDSPFDNGLTLATLALASLPEFVIGIVLVLLFATSVFEWLPPVSRLDPDALVLSQLDLLVLPTAALVLAVAPYIIRMMRASTIEVLESEYVAMARLKGVPERLVLWRHALPNAVVPAIQGTAVQLAWLAGGIVTIEYLFAYPGIGGAFVDAVASRDLPVIQAISLILAAAYVLINLIADILTILISPRLRTGLR